MSFGGGKDQYILEYLVKVTNQGGASGFNQINTGIKQMDQATKQATFSQEKLVAAQNKVQQAQMGVSKAMKGMAFGFLGITTAGAEMVGMLSMYQATQEGVKEAQDAANEAMKEGGKGSKDYKAAMQDVAKANRWASMTFRNMMLSIFDMIPFIILTINGFMKEKRAAQELGKAKQELKVITDAMTKSNAGLAASNKLVDGSYLGVTKGAKTVATAQKGIQAANLATNGSLITMIPNLTKQRAEMAAVSGASAKFRGAMAAAGAAIGSFSKKILPIAAIIGTIIVAVEAWKNNWGGFGDVINAVGAKIGSIHPILKTTMEMFAKLGLTIDALVHGNFDAIKQIWAGAPKEGPIKTMTKAEEKAAEEWDKLVEDVKSSTLELMSTLAQADHKERGGMLKAMGFKGSAKKELQEVFDGLDKVQDSFKGLVDTFKIMDQVKILPDLKIDKKKFSKALFTLEDRISEAAKDTFKKGSTSRKLLEGLSDALHKDAKSKNPENAKATSEYLIQHPEVIKLAKESGAPQEVVDALTVKYKQALAKQQADLKAEQAKIVAAMSPEKLLSFQTSGGFMTDEQKDAWWDKMLPEGGDEGDTKLNEMFTKFKTSITKGISDLKTAITGADWAGIGTTVNQKFTSIFNATNAAKVGQMARIYLVDPIAATFTGLGIAIQAATAGWVAEFKKNPVGTIIGTVNDVTFNISTFVATLLGYTSEQDMFNQWKLQFQKFFSSNPYLVAIRDLIADPIEGFKTLLGLTSTAETTGSQANEEAGTEGGGQGFISDINKWLNDTFVTPIQEAISVAWNTLSTFLGGMGWIDQLLKGDIAGAIGTLFEGIKKVATSGTPQNKDLTNWFRINVSDPIIGGFDYAWKLVVPVLEKHKWIKKLLDGDIWGAVQELFATQSAESKLTLPNKGTGTPGSAGTPTNPIPLNGDLAVKPTGLIINTDDIQGGSLGGCGGMGGSFGGLGGCQLPMDTITVAPKLVQVSTTNSSTSFGSDSVDMMSRSMISLRNIWEQTMTFMAEVGATTFGAIATSFASNVILIFDQFKLLGDGWQVTITALQEGASTAGNGIYNNLHSGFQQTADNADDLVKHWDVNMTDFQEAASEAGNGIYKNLHSGFQQVADNSDDLAKHWSAVCNSMIKNAKSAASGIKSALNSIPKEIVTIHRIKTVTEGSAAKGGIISAATGRMMTTYGPRMLMIGDNPGGRETLVAIPHDNPGPTLAKVAAMFGDQSNASFSTVNTSGGSGGRGGGRGVRVDIHNHLLERDVLNIINIDKGRMISKYNR